MYVILNEVKDLKGKDGEKAKKLRPFLALRSFVAFAPQDDRVRWCSKITGVYGAQVQQK